jgi:hypothetical protein
MTDRQKKSLTAVKSVTERLKERGLATASGLIDGRR